MNWREKLADWISGGRLANEMTAARILCLDAAKSSAETAELREQAAQEAEFLATVTAAKHRAELEADKLARDLDVLLYDNRNGWQNSERFSAALRATLTARNITEARKIAREALGEP